MAWAAEFASIPPPAPPPSGGAGRVTLSGAAAVLNLMLRVIEERRGRALTSEVACRLQPSFVPDEDTPQATRVAQACGTEAMLHAVVRAALGPKSAHLEELLATAEIARSLDLSDRRLERAFNSATGESPLRCHRRRRLDRARQRIHYSAHTVTDGGRSVG